MKLAIIGRRALVLSTTFVVLLAACGGGGDDTAETANPAELSGRAQAIAVNGAVSADQVLSRNPATLGDHSGGEYPTLPKQKNPHYLDKESHENLPF